MKYRIDNQIAFARASERPFGTGAQRIRRSILGASVCATHDKDTSSQCCAVQRLA